MTVTHRILLAALAMLTLQACGFQLQQPTQLPSQMSATSLVIQDPYSQFARRLSSLLEQQGINIVEQDALAVLEVPENEVRKEILTIGDNARVREYRVRHTVRFRLLDAQGAVLVPEHTLEQSRVISFDEQDILGAAQEEEFLRQNMADSLSRLVVRHLAGSGS